ncbi:MAG: hypothetical protein JXB13_19235 [Phycisphaerae bacterium]|nr:hypothetical protein [Phycisphaerae bacterium]
MSAFRLPDRLTLAVSLAVAGSLALGVASPWGCSAGAGIAAAPSNSNSTGEPVTPEVNDNGSNTPGTGPVLELLGDGAAGGSLYHAVTRGCYVCHGDLAEGTALAPGITTATATEVQGALMSGTRHTGGPQVDLTAQDFADLAAFLEHPDPATPDVNSNGPDADTNGLS